MNIEEIKSAVRAGKKVFHGSRAYEVQLHHLGNGEEQWLVKYVAGEHCISLTNMAGDKLNGKEAEFFTEEGLAKMLMGACSIGDSESWKCVCDPSVNWNGWAQPYIHESAMNSLVEYLNEDPDYKAHFSDRCLSLTIEGDKELFTGVSICGSFYYPVGHCMWCWEFEPEETSKQ